MQNQYINSNSLKDGVRAFFKDLMRLGAFQKYIVEKSRDSERPLTVWHIEHDLILLVATRGFVDSKQAEVWLCNMFSFTPVSFYWSSTHDGSEYWSKISLLLMEKSRLM